MMERRRSVRCVAVFLVAVGWAAVCPLPAEDRPARPDHEAQNATQIAAGEELFRREWLPNDVRSHGGDGLGPMFNDTSCVACHNQGGVGGAGAAAKNVELLSAIVLSLDDLANGSLVSHMLRQPDLAPGLRTELVAIQLIERFLAPAREASAEEVQREREARIRQRESLAKLHPRFAAASSVVLHHFSNDPDYAAFRMKSRFNQEFLESGGIGGLVIPIHEPKGKRSLDVKDGAIDGPDDAPHPVSYALFLLSDALLTTPGAELSQLNVLMVSGDLTSAKDPAIREALQTKTFSALAPLSETPLFNGNSANLDEETGVAALASRRNPPTLFGAGLVDSIPDDVIEAGARRIHKGFFNVSGRVARLADGRIGRFGWKGQTATLREFAMTACAVELGLHVPEHAQSPLPHKPEYQPPGLDMSQEECDALVAFLSSLPAPSEQPAQPKGMPEYLASGAAFFETVGCATCHTPRLGDVAGIYSDLLLHDLGPDLSDHGEYGGFLLEPAGGPAEDGPRDSEAAAPRQTEPVGGTGTPARRARAATASEWRTPPLWGVRDSAPYLHDGRANTLEEAIAFHGGEAARSTILYFKLPPAERLKLVAFLKTIGTPRAQ